MREDDAGSGPVCSWSSPADAHGQRWDCTVSLTDDQAVPADTPETVPGEPGNRGAYRAWGTDTPLEELPNDLPAEP